MASPFEARFMQDIAEKKRKRNDILEAIERVKNVQVSDISAFSSVISKSDMLLLLQAKIPNVIQIANIIRKIPPSVQKDTKKALLRFYLKDINEEQVEEISRLILFCSPEDQCAVEEVEILAPPTSTCLECNQPLVNQNKMSSITVFTTQNVQSALKLCLRCTDCKLNFGYSMFGNVERGFKFYGEERRYIEASDEIFLERRLCSLQISLANHAWVSFVGFAESYNDTVTSSDIRRFPPDLQQRFTAKNVHRLDRKTVSSSFYIHEIEAEVRERNIDWNFKGKDDDARDDFMAYVDKMRRTENYQHPDTSCSAMCKEKGCENFVSIDGIWKLRHPHCLYPVKAVVPGLPAINYPNVCTEEPETQASAFCKEHSQLARTQNIPTNLRAFIHDYCRISRSGESDGSHPGESSQPGEINLRDAEKVNEVALNLPTNNASNESTAAKAQGTEDFIVENRNILLECDTSDEEREAACNKETGETQKSIRKWSRGLLHFVRGGGFIERWCPLYVSEGPGQVFLITIQYLLKRLENIPEAEWEEFIISYDNMCNLDRLRVARKPLPLPKPYDQMWIKVRKIVDRLHLRNHKNPNCHIKYGSDDLKEKCPGLNTPVAEQVFVWSSRFKRIMCAMPKRRFLFYYHRMVIRRNNYVSRCYKEKRIPEFPSIH